MKTTLIALVLGFGLICLGCEEDYNDDIEQPTSPDVYQPGADTAEEMNEAAEEAAEDAAEQAQDAAEHAEIQRLADQVRQAIQNDQTLTEAASTVIVVVEDGKIVLRGTVPSEDIRTLIVDRANIAAGDHDVSDELEVIE